MSTFTDRWRELNWEDIHLHINSKTAADVERALNARHVTREDMMALLSLPPARIWSKWRNARSGSRDSVLATR